MNEVRMKKRILPAVLAFLMAVSLVPVSAFASTTTYADAFTVCVTGGDEDAKLDGASVDYTIEVDGTGGAKNTVTTTDGEAVIQEMADYAQDIADGKAVTLAYTVSAEGYDTVSDRVAVTDVTGNVDVKLTVKTPDTVNVTVTKTGNGLVRINDQETETSTVEKGGDVKLELIPAKGAYIQELTVKGEPRTVKKGETFQETLTADEDITVSVTFVQEYTVTVTAGKGGKVLLDGEAVTEKTYKEGTEVELSVAADDDYQIESIAIDGTQEDIADTASFTKKLTVDKDTTIAVKFIRVYTVTVTYDSQLGTVETDPAAQGGEVEAVLVKQGSTLTIKATPKENYRVSEVEIDGKAESFDDNRYVKDTPFTRDIKNITAPHTIKITFAPTRQTITVISGKHGKVEYLKITDMAGNVTYLSTNGLVVDNERPHEEFTAPEIVRVSGLTNNKIYNGDVSVVVSANDPVENGVYSGLKQVTYTVYNGTVYNEKDVTQQGVLYSWDGKAPCCQSKEGMGFTVDAKKNNSNDVHILLTAEDNAGNVTSMEYSIKIDITKPIINIEYDKNAADSGTFFRESRRATITVKERNFDDSLVNITLRATNDGADIALPTVSGWTSSGDLHTATIEYTAEGDYTFAIACTDQAGNPNEPVYYADGTVAPTAFTIDKTRPTISVTYDNNSALNGNYYNANRTATVVVTEHNFDASRVNITLRATDDGADIALPTVSGWTSSGDRHTATIAYRRDGLYTFDIDVTDKAGNTSADFTEQTFYVDTTAPTLEITGVADRSANNGDIIPVVSYSDTNYDDAQVNITLTGAMRKGVALDGSYADQHNGKVFTFKNFAKEKEVDDIYTLAATLTDKAGNTTEKTILFSANRFGSTYALSAATDQLNGSYVQTPQDVVVTETNPDALQNIRITLFKNNQTIILQEGTDYRIEVRGGNGQWYEYIYTVLAKNFADDGVYRLTFYSEDAAGNIAENTLDTKKQEIGFGVDKTKPNMVVTNLESDTTYPLENLTVSLSAGDNLLLQSVVVYLDDYSKAYKTWTAEEVAAIVADQGEFTFDIPGDSTGAHQVKIVCTDAAGNEQTEEITNFYVTTNLFVRYYNNKPLFFGSIAAVVVIAGVVIALAAGKKKKNDKEK